MPLCFHRSLSGGSRKSLHARPEVLARAPSHLEADNCGNVNARQVSGESVKQKHIQTHQR